MTITQKEIEALTINEKQELLDMLWSSLHITEEDDIVYDTEGEEEDDELLMLQETLAEYKKDPSTAIPWHVLFEKLKNRNNAG